MTSRGNLFPILRVSRRKVTSHQKCIIQLVKECYSDPRQFSLVAGLLLLIIVVMVLCRKLTSRKLKVQEKLEARFNNLVTTKEQRLEEECQKAEFQPPCKPQQVRERHT